ncbi:unnamed protein product, partial [Linum tenue]
MKVEGLEGFIKELQNPVEDLFYVVSKKKDGDTNWDNMVIIDFFYGNLQREYLSSVISKSR